VLTIGLFLLLLTGLTHISNDNSRYSQEALTGALRRDIAQCYAVEGFYPPNLDYLKDHYGLVYDESVFFIDYSTFGSNVYPDVTVLNTDSGGATTIR
jgi:hypothetical protein